MSNPDRSSAVRSKRTREEREPRRLPLGWLTSRGMSTVWVGLALLLIGLWSADSPFWIRVATSAAIAYILVGSFDIVFGRAGLFSLSHVAFYGVGAYTSVILEARLGWSFWATILPAVLAATLAAVLIAIPTARLGGIFLALGTLAAGIASEEVALKWSSMTGGAAGFTGIQPPSLFGIELLGGRLPYYWVAAVAALLSFELLSRATTSGFGRRLVALRESQMDVQSVGVDPFRVRMSAFAISGAFAGFAGTLFAHFALFISPESFSLGRMIEVLIALMIGGAGTRLGPVIGVAAMVAIDEAGHRAGDASTLLFGLAIIVVIGFLPGGLAGLMRSAWQRARRGRALPVAEVVAPAGDRAGRIATKSGDVPPLRAQGIRVTFDGVLALDGVDITLPPGAVTGLIGPNGAGKTSLVNVITGHVTPDAGTVRFGDVDLTGRTPQAVVREGVVRTFQRTRLIPSFDLVTNIMLGRERYGRATLLEEGLHLPRSQADDEEARAEALRLLRLVGIEEEALRRSDEVAYGVRRRAEIAKALAVEPSYLLLDEPGAGLSAYEREEVAEVIRRLAEDGVGCLLIDHNIAFVASVCERITVLAAGRVLAEGPTAEVLAHEEVIEAYLGKAAHT